MMAHDNEPRTWDAIIVGAGVAGLAAAHRLAGMRVLVCEQAAAPGGRVQTVDVEGHPAELGAMFPSRRLLAWAGARTAFRRRSGRLLALLPSGDVLAAATRRELLEQARVREVAEPVRDALLAATHFVGGTRLNRGVRALADLEQGLEQPVGGAKTLLDALATGIDNLQTSTTAESFSLADGVFSVTLARENERRIERTTTLLLAADLSSTRALLHGAGIVAPAFVSMLNPESVEVALFSARIDPAALPNYAVIVGSPVNTLAFTATDDGHALVCAYGAGDAPHTLGDAELEACVQALLASLGLRGGTAARMVFRKRWPMAVVPVDDQQASTWRRDDCAPQAGLFLAGDYLYPLHSLGLEPAFIVGAQAGERARLHARRRRLTTDDANTGRRVLAAVRQDLQALLDGVASEAMAALSPLEAPARVGDVVAIAAAIAGLRAAGVADDDALLQRALAWLMAARTSGMWAYTRGGLPTATDSALVTHFVPECDWSALLPEYLTPAGVLPQLHGDTQGAERRMRIEQATMHWCQADPFTTLLCSANEIRAGRAPLLDADALRRLHGRRAGLFVANPFLVDLAFLLAVGRAPSPETAALRDDVVLAMCRARGDDGQFGTFDRGLSTALVVLGLAAAGALSQRDADDLRRALLRSDVTGGATPFCSTRYCGRQPPGRSGLLPFYEFGGLFELRGKFFALTLYRDSLDLVTRGLWLQAMAALRDGATAGASAGQLSSLPAMAAMTPAGAAPDTVTRYCARVLQQFQ